MRKKLLLFLGCALLAGGALALSWYGSLQMELVRTQRAAARIVDRSRERAERSPRTIVIVPPRPGEPVGRMEIPRVHLSAMVLEGTSPKDLKAAAGHVHGTAFPGVIGNIAIAGHRDTLFRPLRNVRPRDEVIVTTSYGTFRYVVNSTEVVGPDDIEVLHNTSDAELTLVTCFPFTYAGLAPKRFIVHAQASLNAFDEPAGAFENGRARNRHLEGVSTSMRDLYPGDGALNTLWNARLSMHVFQLGNAQLGNASMRDRGKFAPLWRTP